MARYSGPFPGYSYALQFDLRTAPEGGNLARLGKIVPPEPLTRRELVVLVHGYNNHRAEAQESYYWFRWYQSQAVDPKLLPQELNTLFGDTFWPGDANWWGPLDLLDFLVYPVAVHTSIDAAPLLADLLLRTPGLVTVSFLAHSLGCRVTLETVKRLHEAGGPHVERIGLMAAAVERSAVEPRGEFAGLLADLANAGTRLLVLHSTDDKVLHFAFPLGQTAAGEGILPDALGRFGPPPGMPGLVEQEQIAGANHSDYWGQTRKDAAVRANKRAGEFLGIGERARKIDTRSAVALREVSELREIGAAGRWAEPAWYPS